MASQRVSRYIAVQQAKGLDPDPQQVARMIQQDTESRIASVPSTENRAAAIQESIAPSGASSGDTKSFSPTLDFEGGGGSIAPGVPDLGGALSAKGNLSTIGKGAVKGTVSGFLSALTVPSKFMSPVTAFVKGFATSTTAPVSLALALNAIIGNSVASAQIGHSIESAFGKEAAQEAADAITGTSSLDSISIAGQHAHANAMVAQAYTPTTLTGLLSQAVTGLPPNAISVTGPPIGESNLTGKSGFTPMGLGPVGGFSPMGIQGVEGLGLSQGDDSGFSPMGLGDVGEGPGVAGGPTPGTGMGGR